MNLKGWGAVGAVAVGSGAVLVGCADQPVRLIHGLRAPHAWVAAVGPDAAVSALAGSLLWLIALWAALALSATALSLLPGRAGLLADAVAANLSPAVLRRVVVAAAGTSILISPVAANADPAAGGAPAATGNSAPASMTAVPLPMDRPAASWPMDQPAARPGGVQVHAGGRVSVRPGDSLWTIAAHRLGKAASPARVQAEWPRWYAANRRLIGADPNLLRPGASLLPPKPTATSGAASTASTADTATRTDSGSGE